LTLEYINCKFLNKQKPIFEKNNKIIKKIIYKLFI